MLRSSGELRPRGGVPEMRVDAQRGCENVQLGIFSSCFGSSQGIMQLQRQNSEVGISPSPSKGGAGGIDIAGKV